MLSNPDYHKFTYLFYAKNPKGLVWEEYAGSIRFICYVLHLSDLGTNRVIKRRTYYSSLAYKLGLDW